VGAGRDLEGLGIVVARGWGRRGVEGCVLFQLEVRTARGGVVVKGARGVWGAVVGVARGGEVPGSVARGPGSRRAVALAIAVSVAVAAGWRGGRVRV